MQLDNGLSDISIVKPTSKFYDFYKYSRYAHCQFIIDHS